MPPRPEGPHVHGRTVASAGLSVTLKCEGCARLAIFKGTVKVKDGGCERAVSVTVDAPSLDGLDIQALAQATWLEPAKRPKVGEAAVKVEKFNR